MNKTPRIIFTDIDGVWTDGGMYYDNQNNEFKKFNAADGAGVLYCRALGIPIAIITGEDTKIVQRRAEKLKIEYVFQGVKNKKSLALQLCEKLKVSLLETAYIGDDINDIHLLQAVGFSACPANAPTHVKDIVHYVTTSSGGDGAFREFVETILRNCGMLEDARANVMAGFEKPNGPDASNSSI